MMKKEFNRLWWFAAVAFFSLVAVQSVYAVEVTLSGQVNRALMWADNGNDSEVFHVDNDNSSTRFRLTGSEQVNDLVTVGIGWENQFESNSSASVDIGQNSDGSAPFTERKLEAYFETPYGKLSIGQGDGAANGTAEMDLSGTSVIMYSGVNDTASSFTFRDDDDTPIATIGSTRSNFDGLSRNDRLRYDSPKFRGFTFSASATNGDAYELALRYAADYGAPGKVAFALGYANSQDRADPEFEQIGGSLSWLHSSGVNVTLAGGSRDIDDANRDPVNFYFKLGYKTGIHAVAVEYGLTEELAQEDDESNNYGVAYVISPWRGTEFYGTYRIFELDREGVNDIEDINQVMVGTRVKF
ncbi:MAG: porin [Desulfosarcinaceae bacterium]|nr:porin [Desulfosarcinaceae bacterium]